jgi:hemerythrin-like domain-containing protein
MPVQIGQKAHHFGEPIGLLTDCHRRIERFLGNLRAVADSARGGRLNEEQTAALSGALQYFRDAAPKHTADEEESLFPRMREIGGEEMAALLTHLERLEADHVRADRLHREVNDLGEAWLRNRTLPRESAERLVSLLDNLMRIYEAHIALEDSQVFPVAGRVLSQSVQQAIGREMAARRTIAISNAT